VSKYEFIDSRKNDPTERNPVTKMCLWLMVSTSGFYHWLSRPQSATAARRDALAARIRHFFTASDGTYGYRRIHADLAGEDTECSPELVRQIMRQEGLLPCQPRPFRVATEADAEAAANMPDLLERDFIADRPGVKFVGDITYIHTWQRFIYLATVIDCYWQESRRLVDRRSHAHRTGRRRAQERCVNQPGRGEGGLSFRQGERRLHVGGVSGLGGRARDAFLDGENGGVLG
jgi:hypothetical protein